MRGRMADSVSDSIANKFASDRASKGCEVAWIGQNIIFVLDITKCICYNAYRQKRNYVIQDTHLPSVARMGAATSIFYHNL